MIGQYPKQIYVRIVRAESYRDQEKGHQNESKYDQSESSKLSSSTIVESANLMEAEALEPEMEMVNNLGRYSKSNYAAPPLPRPATSTIVNRKIFAANSAADSLIAY